MGLNLKMNTSEANKLLQTKETKAMYDTTHYAALMTRLSNEKGYLALATKQSEIDLRTVWIKQIEKEIAQEAEFLKSKGIDVYHSVVDNNLSEDELLNELFGE